MDYMIKINDFKRVFSEIMNPYKDEYKQILLDALFDNVRINYEEYKDSFDKISVKWEPYKYHILQPIDGYYDLLDFLLNRAISNLEKIQITTTGGNEHSNHLEISMDKNRYVNLNTKKTKDEIAAQYKKSNYHETLHLLHSRFSCSTGGFYSNNEVYFKQKVNYFYNMLGKKYSNVMNPHVLNGVSRINTGTVLTKPFGMYDENGKNCLPEGGFTGLDECAVEMEAVINSGLINSKNVDWVHLGDNFWQVVPNYDNGYVNYQMFLIQLKSLISKENYFSSSFFHNSDAIEEFAMKYRSYIMLFSRGNSLENDPVKTVYNLFNKVYSNMYFHSKNIDVYKSLTSIFIEIYRSQLANVDLLDDETLMRYKNALAISYNEAPSLLENGEMKSTGIKDMYFEYYNIVCEELKRRDIKGNRR